MRALLLTLAASLALGASAQDADLGKPIDDGVRAFVVEALKAVQKEPKAKERLEPFALGLTGWKMRGMAPFLFSNYEALQFKVAALGLGLWDPKLGQPMAAVADRAQPDAPATLTDDERSQLNLGTIAHAERFAKAGGAPQWEYFVGAGFGELGTQLTLWIYMQNEASLAAELTKNLKGLGEKADKAPEGANKELVAALKALAAMAEDTYARPDVERIADAAGKAMLLMLKAG